MNGDYDPLYIQAREVLLDALEALGSQRRSVVLAGAQAIYLHAGEADLAIAPYTTDGDIALDPALLEDKPLLEDALRGAGFVLTTQPGSWAGKDGIVVDLLVPASLGGPGKRGARLGVHGKRVARKVHSMEVVLVDKDQHEISSLNQAGSRSFEIAVAGPAALLVTKLYKIAERADVATRLRDKDALDILRLLRAIPPETMAKRMNKLKDAATTSAITQDAIGHLRDLFGTATARGSQMAARAATPLEDPETISKSCEALAQELLAACAGFSG